jgi:cholesterol transport system auxiliary component
MRRPLTLLFACLALSGCAALAALDQAATPLDVHELRAPAELPQARATSPLHLSVEVPSTGGAIETDRILVRTSPTQIAYLPDARWSASAPQMLQTAMVETFLRADAFAFVERRPLGPAGDLALVTTLLDFGAEVAGEGAVVEMTLVARLVRERDASILSRRTFRRTVPVPDTSSAAILAGYAAASETLLGELAGWVIAASR